MGRVCTVCAHPDRTAIDASLVNAAEPKRGIARRYSLEDDAVRRHADRHLTAEVRQVAGIVELTRLDALLADVTRLRVRAEQLGKDAERDGDRRLALSAVRESRECLALLAKLTGDLDESPTVNVLIAGAEWQSIYAALLDALRPFPEARIAAAERVLTLQGPTA